MRRPSPGARDRAFLGFSTTVLNPEFAPVRVGETAQAGTVASAIRFLAKAVLTSSPEEFFRRADMGDLRRAITGESGIGREIVLRFLAKAVTTRTALPSGVEISTPEYEKQGIGWKTILQCLSETPGINTGSVQQQLANLKASGDYARIIREV